MQSPVLRLLDANANRAREGLRVLEDYARFVLSDALLSAECKSLRHELTRALRPWLGDAVLQRDSIGDVGANNKTASEFHRAEARDVLTAAAKRVQEAVRILEEWTKTLDTDAGAASRRFVIAPMTWNCDLPAGSPAAVDLPTSVFICW